MDSPLMDMKYFDAFSGYGGFSLGIKRAYEKLCSQNKEQSEMSPFGDSERQCSEQSDDGSKGLTCIGYSEINKYAIETYSKHFPDHKNYGDITKIHPQDIPDFDLLVGGFPCQAFSIAGKRAGFEDTRGTLIFDVLRILKEKHPRLVLLENVKGLLSHDGGRTFKTIITSLAELGYAVEWQVLNAKNFGVPQNRERVFIIGHLGGFGGRQVFPLTGDDRQDTESDGERLIEVFPTIRATHYKSGDN
jgi:DNA (cytosine-5)-methyltransferase 1